MDEAKAMSDYDLDLFREETRGHRTAHLVTEIERLRVAETDLNHEIYMANGVLVIANEARPGEMLGQAVQRLTNDKNTALAEVDRLRDEVDLAHVDMGLALGGRDAAIAALRGLVTVVEDVARDFGDEYPVRIEALTRAAEDARRVLDAAKEGRRSEEACTEVEADHRARGARPHPRARARAEQRESPVGLRQSDRCARLPRASGAFEEAPVKHVIREGTEKGRGRYWNGAGRFDNNWSARPCDASGMSASLAQKTAQQMGGRVVRLLSAAESRERARQRGVRQVIDAIRAARCSEAMTAAEWSTVILVEKYIVRLLCPCQGADPGPGHVEGCPRGVSGMGGGV